MFFHPQNQVPTNIQYAHIPEKHIYRGIKQKEICAVVSYSLVLLVETRTTALSSFKSGSILFCFGVVFLILDYLPALDMHLEIHLQQLRHRTANNFIKIISFKLNSLAFDHGKLVTFLNYFLNQTIHVRVSISSVLIAA